MTSTNETVNRMMQETGQLHDRSLIGGYPLIYFNRQDEILCASCATEQVDDIKHVRTYDEGATLNCTNCNKPIESAYGDPEEEEQEG